MQETSVHPAAPQRLEASMEQPLLVRPCEGVTVLICSVSKLEPRETLHSRPCFPRRQPSFIPASMRPGQPSPPAVGWWSDGRRAGEWR